MTEQLRESITNAIIDNMPTLNGLNAAVAAIMGEIEQHAPLRSEVQTQSALRAALQEIDEIGRKITDLKNEHGIRMGNIAHAALLGAGTAAQAAPEPSVWILKYRTKNTPENVSAYLNEKDAQRAASNVRMYAHASEVAVVPAYSMPSAQRDTHVCEICGKREGTHDKQFEGFACDECKSQWTETVPSDDTSIPSISRGTEA